MARRNIKSLHWRNLTALWRDNLKYLALILTVTVAGILAAGPALARGAPNPPPSGIVIHLFGPNSIGSQILPDSFIPGSGGGGSAKPEAEAHGAAQTPYVEPTTQDILHQMFVTGDPNRKPGDAFAPGRDAEH